MNFDDLVIITQNLKYHNEFYYNLNTFRAQLNWIQLANRVIFEGANPTARTLCSTPNRIISRLVETAGIQIK